MFNIGKLLGKIASVRYDVYFFIPHMNTGGAEQVHLTTLKLLKEEGYRVTTIVTATPENSLKKEFQAISKMFDIRKSHTNRKLFFFFLGFWSTIINKRAKSIVIGSHSYFFYRLIPFLKSEHKIIDVIHNLEPGPEMRYGELFNSVSGRIDNVVCVDEVTKELIQAYSKRESVEVIYNPTDQAFFENFRARKSFNQKCVFVGRDDKVKRVHLIKELSKRTNFQTGLIGAINQDVIQTNLIYHGLIKDRIKLSKVLNQYDVLLVLSSTEAFPMVIQEGMAQGLVCICTNVGGIKKHITHLKNGILIDKVENEEEVLRSVTDYLSLLESDAYLFESISIEANRYAREKFRYQSFKVNIENLLV